MTLYSHNKRTSQKRVKNRSDSYFGKWFLMVALLSLSLFSAKTSQAQFIEKWLAVGDFHATYSSATAWSEFVDPGSNWYPGLYNYRGHMRGQAMWIATTDWDPTGIEQNETEPYEVKVAHRGPREPGFDQFFNTNIVVTSKFEPPITSVDGLETFDKPIINDVVDETMKADRKIDISANTAVGVSVEQTIYAFSQEYHDNYHIIEYTFTNTGNVDEDDEQEFNRTLTDVVIGWINRYNNSYEAGGLPGGVGWGRQTLNDVVGDGNKTYDRDFKAVYAWAAHWPDFGRWNTIGNPQVTNQGWFTAAGDSIGRLVGSGFVGRATIEASPSEDGNTNQPFTTNYMGSDNPLTASSSQFNRGNMVQEYELLTAGNVYPFHADVIQPPDPANGEGGVLDPIEWRERFSNQYNAPNVNADPGGTSSIIAYGPYDLDPGESVSIVVVEGVDGLSWTHNYVIGNGYKKVFEENGFPDADNVAYTFEEAYNRASNLETPVVFPQDGLDIDALLNDNTQLTKNEWVLSGRDSLMDMFDAAIDNYNNGFDIPQPPMPPQTFDVNSGAEQISLEWTINEEPANWEIYRAKASIDSPFVLLEELPGNVNSFDDASAQRGINYYYYLQAVGSQVTEPYAFRDPGTHDAAPRQVRLKSSRYYTQTYAPAQLRRAPTGDIQDIRVVPNPYNLASQDNVRWTDQQDKIGFLDIPGYCTIQIFTEVGELIKTIEHTDGSGDEYWNLTTEYNQLIVSGIYILLIKERDAQGNLTGNQLIRKFTVIR